MISGCFEYVSHWSARTLRRSACKTRHIDWAVQLYPVPLPPKGGDGVTQVIAHLQAHLVVHLARAAKPDRRQRATDRSLWGAGGVSYAVFPIAADDATRNR